ncbi:ATP synthase mitochondrial F1 complex assembly factor 2 [Culicoides brevitarsis]|uniref:ATP synthase mitochondrial F1 complex assembly factor 2 n=1 Tax=Culicoides brevitarsis TaxID=469753 RepID=UPI00307BB8F0
MLRNIVKIFDFKPISVVIKTQTRFYAALPKRFYKHTGVLQSNGKFEITLDNKKLKTPNGSVLVVNSEPLALGVASEWDSQKETVDRSSMHLTALVNTAVDNPNKLTKIDIVNYLINYIQTDTVLFHSFEEKPLAELQAAEWTPIIEWFNKEFNADIKHTSDISVPTISQETKMNISNYLNSYDLAALHGFSYAVDTLKSIVLAFACIKQKISVEKAVLLSRLEEEFQMGHWGRVEWAHDLAQQELQARLAAAVLFIYCNSSHHLVKEKLPV